MGVTEKLLNFSWLILFLIFTGLTLKAVLNWGKNEIATVSANEWGLFKFPSFYICPFTVNYPNPVYWDEKATTLEQIEKIPSLTDYINVKYQASSPNLTQVSNENLKDFFWIQPSQNNLVARCLFVKFDTKVNHVELFSRFNSTSFNQTVLMIDMKLDGESKFNSIDAPFDSALYLSIPGEHGYFKTSRK